ncbi:Alkylhydroperoxidase AhpD core [Sphingopyxis sp. LC81]|uniref:carboxymuconolactone decarboxylase family protein n=1 Tax=Sphingopyxis sp. LC81 TaxID=1502850 RepID=UPI00050E701A|nr:carboxymuconolactone decarboxylase family protein [Sphingopyxis sp. LC81]KGB53593.1 Alkylhydroperoxidase AhpD core [Sphingopyxis sp. LC81]
MTETFRTTLPLRRADDGDPAVSTPLQAAQKAMGMVPNMYAAMANLPGLLEAYNFAYSKFRAEAGFTAIEQEVVLLTISRINECHYCVAAHSFVADAMSKVPAEVTDAIRADQPISDRKLEALRRFVATMTESRGNPSPAEAEAFLAAGYQETHILGIILALSAKVISNYSNHIFHTEVDPAFAGRAWTPPA